MVNRALTSQPFCLPDAPTVSETGCPFMISPDAERELLCRVAVQEPQAFDTLYARYAPRMRGYLVRSLCPSDLIDEVIQDVMLVLWQYAARIPPGVSLMAWLCGVARHKARKACARASRPLGWHADYQPGAADDPEAVLLRQEHVRTLLRTLATLPPGERAALELRVYQGCSHQEIATLTGEPVSTVRTRVSRARQRLRARIATGDYGAAASA